MLLFLFFRFCLASVNGHLGVQIPLVTWHFPVCNVICACYPGTVQLIVISYRIIQVSTYVHNADPVVLLRIMRYEYVTFKEKLLLGTSRTIVFVILRAPPLSPLQ